MGLARGALPCRGGSVVGKKAERPRMPFPGEHPWDGLDAPVQRSSISQVHLPGTTKERSVSGLTGGGFQP